MPKGFKGFQKGEKMRLGSHGWNKGKHWSMEVRQKMSQAAKGRPSWKKGLKNIMPEEEKRRLVASLKKFYQDNPHKRLEISNRMKGSKNVLWKGGITPINTKIRMSLEYKLWREAVFKRDNWTCIWCGARSKVGEKVEIQADHIKPFAKYPELRFSIDNGRTLCRPCHKTTDTWGRTS
jgi:hypothetical protein